MKQLSMDYTGARVTPDALEQASKKLLPEIERIRAAHTLKYASKYASVYLPHDTMQHAQILKLVTEKKALKPTLLIVIGIGGSNLGTLAVHQALQGTLYNYMDPAIKLFFLESVDSATAHDVLKLVTNALVCNQQVIVNVVTKSGTTTETVANFLLILQVLQKHDPHNYKKSIVVTTNFQSKLWNIAKQEGFDCLEIPEQVGGRYSVLSAVGIFPLEMVGIDTASLLRGAHDMLGAATYPDVQSNPAALSACIKYVSYQRGIRIHDMFVFGQSLAGIGQWYRQLMGESLGKTAQLDGKTTAVGITPTTSVGTTDLHSVGQLYLGGPSDKLITFVRPLEVPCDESVPYMPVYEQLVTHVQGQTFSTLMAAMCNGVLAAYRKEERPFLELLLPCVNAYYIGQLLQMYMIEMMYLGFLLGVDPFDQPHVELYKEQTRKILAHE